MSQQINLYNPIFRKKRFSFTSSAAMAYTVGTTAAIVVLIGLYQDRELGIIEARARAVDAAHKEATARIERLNADVGKQKPDPAVIAEITSLEAQLAERQETVQTLNDGVVGNTSGFSEYMRAFARQSVHGLWLTGFDIAQAGNALAIEGRALSADLVATYLARLNEEKALKGRRFAAMRISVPRPAPAIGAASGDQDPKQKDAKLAAAGESKPLYLDFNISTSEIVESAQQMSESTGLPRPLLGALDLSPSSPAPTAADGTRARAEERR